MPGPRCALRKPRGATCSVWLRGAVCNFKQRTACQCFTPSPCPGLTLERLRRRAACRAGPEEELPPPRGACSREDPAPPRASSEEGKTRDASPPPPTPHAKRSGVTGRRRGRGRGPDGGRRWGLSPRLGRRRRGRTARSGEARAPESTAAVCGESTGRVKRSPKVHVGLKMPPASTKLSTTGIFSKIEI